MEINVGEEQDKIIDDLQKWFEDNKKLPNKIDRIFLTRFYYCMSKDIEATRKLLEINYSMRHSSPDLFINRDATDEDTRNTYAYTYMTPLPGLTPEHYLISYVGFKNSDPKMMHFTQDIKTWLMISDCRFSLPDVVIDNVPLLSLGDIYIIDMDGFRMQHVAGISIRSLRTYLKFLHQAYSVRIKGLHMINCPSYLNKILAVVKPFISKEVFEMMHFHTNGLATLYEYVPKDMLPAECGGNAGKISDLNEEFRKTLEKHRDYLMDENFWKIQKC